MSDKKDFEFYIFDEKLEFLSTFPIDKNVTFEWQEKIFENDVVDIKISYENITDVKSKKYDVNKSLFESLTSIYKVVEGKEYITPRFIACDLFDKNNTRIAYIESYDINETDKKIEIKALGVLRLLDYRYTYEKEYIPSPTQLDTVGQVFCKVVNEYISVDPVLSKILVANEVDNIVGAEVFFMTELGDSVYEKLLELLTAYELGFSTLLDYDNKKIILKIIDLSDRIPTVAVSKDDNNLTSNAYSFDMSNYRNYINANAVYKVNEDEERAIVEDVDLTNGCIILATTTDIKKNQYKLTENEYRELIRQEATNELKNNTVTESFDIDIKDSVSLSLGDKAVCKVFLGYKQFAKETKVVEIKHTIKDLVRDRELTFDSPYDSKRELKKILGV